MAHVVHNIVNSLYSNTNIKYLELGIGDGKNFSDIKLQNKVSVDIMAHTHRPTYMMTTDEYFQNHKDKFDIIFIDADHSAKQVLKDFNNSVDCLNKGGIIFLHDMYPPKIEDTHPLKCDDSYKLLFYFLRNEYDILVDTSDYGSTCVFNPKKIDFNAVNFDLPYEEFISKHPVNRVNIFSDYSSFENNFKNKKTI